MKKVIALGIATCFAFSAYADQKITNTGKSFLRYEPIFESASPERVSLFASVPESRAGHRANHNGDFQLVVFGGKNTSQAAAGQYYFPKTADGVITFNSSIDALNGGTDTLQTYWSGTQDETFGTGSTVLANIGTGAGSIGYTGTSGTAVAAGTLGTPTAVAGVSLGIHAVETVLTSPAANDLGYGTTYGASPFPIATGRAIVNNPGTFTSTQGQFALEQAAGTFLPYNLNNLQAFVDTDGAIGDFQIDTNRNTAIVRPWNFGIGYAPNVQMGADVTESAFISTITPELERSHWGIGATWKQILSDNDTGFWLELSTALQRVTMNMNLNEDVTTDLAVAGSAGAVPNWSAVDNGYATAAVTTVAQAFAQDAWLYGKIDGAQSVTRLADIEFKVGYQFVCEDNVLTNGYVGMIIPTGNKATAVYMAEPIVGNGFHFGLMAGGTYEIQLNDGDRTRWSMRADSCYRYLFQNTQVRSFDTNNGNWSRYMYVWESYAAEQLAELTSDAATLRAYTPGINVFTQEVNVTPQAQVRFNQALVLESGAFKGELGWNVLIRQDELVTLVNEWVDNAVVYADASNSLFSLYNANRTIYNDAYQSSPVAATTADASLARYNAASVQASDLNLNSAASWSTMVNTPYLVLGYGFGEEHSSVISIGGSYEFTASNDYINDWMLWGKFSFTF